MSDERLLDTIPVDEGPRCRNGTTPPPPPPNTVLPSGSTLVSLPFPFPKERSPLFSRVLNLGPDHPTCTGPGP